MSDEYVNLFIDLDKCRIVGHNDDFKALEDWAIDNVTYNYDIIDGTDLFGKSYTQKELTRILSHLTKGESPDLSDKSREYSIDLIRRAIRAVELPEIDTTTKGAKAMPTREKAKENMKKEDAKAAKEPKPAAEAKSTRARVVLDKEVKIVKGPTVPKDGTVKGDIYSFVSEPMTVDELLDAMETTGYTPEAFKKKEKGPADRTYLRGYITAMIRNDELVAAS